MQLTRWWRWSFGGLQKMDTCRDSFSKKKGHMPNNQTQNKHMTKERRNKCGMVRALQVQVVGMVGETWGICWHGAKVATWHVQ